MRSEANGSVAGWRWEVMAGAKLHLGGQGGGGAGNLERGSQSTNLTAHSAPRERCES